MDLIHENDKTNTKVKIIQEGKSDRITSLESDFDGLNQIQREDKAYETARKIRGRNYGEIISIDYDAINGAVKLIEDKDIKSPDLKVMIKSLLAMILELHQFGEEMFNYNQNKFISDVKETVELTEGEVNQDTGYAGKIGKVQDYITNNFHSELQDVKTDKSKEMTIKKAIRDYVSEHDIRLEGVSTIEDSSNVIIKSILGYDILDEIMTQPVNTEFSQFVEEIRIDDYNDIRIVKGGKEIRTDLSFQTPEHALLFANKLIRDSAAGAVTFGKDNPFARIRVGETTRVSIMRDPIATRPVGLAPMGSPVVQAVIRRQRSKPFTPEFLVENNSISEYGNSILKAALKYGISGCMYGGTGTGKTAMFTAYAYDVQTKNRIITFAEVDEMSLRKLDHRKNFTETINGETVEFENPEYMKAINSVIMWESPDKTTEIVDGLKGFEGMLNAALTMSPDSIFLQETKGGELLDLMQAALSDHQVWTTLHVTSYNALPKRLVMMAQRANPNMSETMIKSIVVDAFPLIVGCTRYVDGSRRISSIVEFKDYNTTEDKFDVNELMRYEVINNVIEDGKLVTLGKFQAGNLPSDALRQKMLENGLLEEDWREITTTRENSEKIE